MMSYALALAVLAAVPAFAEDHEDYAKELSVQQSEQHGSYLADAEGRALYMYTADTQGQSGMDAVSNCYDTCADAWPPFVAAEKITDEETAMPEESAVTDPTTLPETSARDIDPATGLPRTTPTAQEGMMTSEIDKALIGTTARKDGAKQLTYNGWPLYYYEKDMSAGQTSGHTVKDAMGEWYLLSASGEKIEHEKAQL